MRGLVCQHSIMEHLAGTLPAQLQSKLPALTHTLGGSCSWIKYIQVFVTHPTLPRTVGNAEFPGSMLAQAWQLHLGSEPVNGRPLSRSVPLPY